MSHKTNKGLLSRIYKYLPSINIKESKKPIKMDKYKNRLYKKRQQFLPFII